MGELLQRFWETTIKVQPHGLHTQLINIAVVAEIIDMADNEVHSLAVASRAREVLVEGMKCSEPAAAAESIQHQCSEPAAAAEVYEHCTYKFSSCSYTGLFIA